MSSAARDRAFRTSTFLAINLIVASAVYLLIVAPLYELLWAGPDTLAAQRAILARTLRASAIARTIADTKIGQLPQDFYEGSNEGAATAALLTSLKTLAAQTAAVPRSIQTLPMRKVGELQMVGARLEVSGTIVAIRNLVFGIETATPALFIMAGNARAPQTVPGQPGEEPLIEARFDIFAAIGGAPLR